MAPFPLFLQIVSDLHHFRPLPYLRCKVLELNAGQIVVETNDDSTAKAVLKLRNADNDEAYSQEYLLNHLHIGSQINLLDYKLEDGDVSAGLIILEPDYLLDISSVAACFDTGSPLQFLLSRLSDGSSSSFPILLGNFASQLLDEALHFPHSPRPYVESIRDFFESYAIDFATCTDSLSTFHQQAEYQRDNIRKLIATTAVSNPDFHPEKCILEPSFFVEMLGLQGRMDLLQADMKVLMEQKSGQRGFNGIAREPHYIQMLLYLAILHYAVGEEPSDVSSYLLYSKFADGMMPESFNDKLLAKAIRMRNLIVANEMQLATMKDFAQRLFLNTTADDLRQNPSLSERFWLTWKRPGIDNVLSTIQHATPLEQSYFFRMFRFVAREQMLARMGGGGVQATGQALLWRRTVEERLAEGSLLWPLHVEKDDAEANYSRLLLHPEDENVAGECNFREGDAVIVYALQDGDVPDARQSILFRGFIESLQVDTIVVCLTSPQSCGMAFPSDACYAVEHDSIDTSRSQYRGLFSILSSPPDRRALWFGQRKPRFNVQKTARGAYGQFQDLVDGACRAEDVYLVVGPPGTGKTSFGMLNILQEELLDIGSSVLLTAYTNRAVDEICSKLDAAGIDFLRIGRSTSCDAKYADRLLSSRAKTCKSRNELIALIDSARVVVATTTTLGRNADFLRMRRFDLCIVDEASQILEPQILPLFAATKNGASCIRRFVLIGDHKQLPAVVVQDRADSAVEEPMLQEMGLEDCRHSLFQRLIVWLRKVRPECIFEMTRQGRMHPLVADFANRFFYSGKLVSAGLPHQLEEFGVRIEQTLDKCLNISAISNIVKSSRFAFFNVRKGADDTTGNNSNTAEAKTIAAIVRAAYTNANSAGVIVPYRSQITLVRKYIGTDLDVTIDTVERYQGSERDVIVYGFTASTQAGLDFLTAENFHDEGETIDRKLNVALTRARKQLFVVGDAALLAQDAIFDRLVEYARSEHAFIEISGE